MYNTSTQTKGKKMTIGQTLLNELNAAIEESFEVSNASLPEAFRGKRKARSLASIAKQICKADGPQRDPRGKRGSARLQTLELYAKMAETEQPLQFQPNEDLLYRAELRFAEVLIRVGVLSADDFE